MMHEKKKHVALVLFSLLVTVLIIEGLLRVLGWWFYYQQDKENSGYTLSNDIQLDQTENPQLKPAERKEFVILSIGESTTAGGGMNSWPRQLQRILNNIQDHTTFRVINKGVPGTQTHQISSKLPGYLNTYKPDFVLAMVGLNDYCDTPSSMYCKTFDDLDSIPKNAPLRDFQLTVLFGHFRTYNLVQWIAGGIKSRIIEPKVGPKTDSVYNLIHPNVTHLHPQTIRNLNDMVNLTIERGTKFIFVQYALRKVDLLRNIIERQDVAYISNYEMFVNLLAQHSYEDLFVDDFAEDFGHATAFGNRMIADNVVRQLLILFEFK